MYRDLINDIGMGGPGRICCCGSSRNIIGPAVFARYLLKSKINTRRNPMG